MRADRQFRNDPGSPRSARRFVLDALAGVPEQVAENIELMVSELTTNCIRHARTGFTVGVDQRPGRIDVEVTDVGGGFPALCVADQQKPSSRGLGIVDRLADSWGVSGQISGPGKTVWFTITTPGI